MKQPAQIPEYLDPPVSATELQLIDENARQLRLGIRRRCTNRDNGGALECGREEGHDGQHSISICNTDRVYVWP